MVFEKWYLDCVTPEGAGMIGYVARLGWGSLGLKLAETLCWNATGGGCDRLALGGSWPVESPDEVHWESAAARTEGRWRRLAPGLAPTVLHAEPAGRIEWTCCCPAARATVLVHRTRYDGLGYAEHLRMTLPPERLPLQELHWGRFIAESQTCVWIRWGGRAESRWFFHNGQAVDAAVLAGDDLTWPGYRLHLERGVAVRSGRLGETVFQRAAFLRHLVPAGLVNVRETKWCSRGVLAEEGGRRHAGWAIHEIAVFP